MKNPWFALYTADYLAKTGHLTQAHHGAYFLLMLHYYATGKPIPASAVQVHAICRCTTDAERGAAQHVLQLFFYRDGDFYRHKRIDEELATRSELRTKRQNAASKRWDAKAMHLHTQSQSQGSDLNEIAVVLDVGSKSKPSIEEVRAYCKERGNSVDPAQFMDHYTANGWKIGKSAMKDWRASVRTWERNANGNGNGVKPSKTQQRTDRNRAAIVAGLYGDVSANAGLSFQDDELRTDAGGGPTLEHETGRLLRGRH
jgi:uncharacterized protein YdaU (DUF1376 family)